LVEEIADLRLQVAAWESDEAVLDMALPWEYTGVMEMKEKKDTLLKPATCAAEANVTARTIRNLCASGELRAIRIGGQWRIRRSDWDAYLGREVR